MTPKLSLTKEIIIIGIGQTTEHNKFTEFRLITFWRICDNPYNATNTGPATDVRRISVSMQLVAAVASDRHMRRLTTTDQVRPSDRHNGTARHGTARSPVSRGRVPPPRLSRNRCAFCPDHRRAGMHSRDATDATYTQYDLPAPANCNLDSTRQSRPSTPVLPLCTLTLLSHHTKLNNLSYTAHLHLINCHCVTFVL